MWTWTAVGESALVLDFGDRIDPDVLREVGAWARVLERHALAGVREWVPAYTTLTLYLDPAITQAERVVEQLGLLAERVRADEAASSRRVEIPVCYGGEFGPDLEFVASHNGLSCDDVIRLHSQAEYLVYLIGFAPGFPYLGGLPSQLHAPRLKSPRLEVPAGSVGIAGDQTGIYPFATPGGWRLIGRTPWTLFRPEQRPPSLLQAGDVVRFRPIAVEDFRSEREHQNGV